MHADGSRVSIDSVDPPLWVPLSVRDSVFLSVFPHNKTKTTETKIAKLGAQIVHHDTSLTNEY